MAYLLRKLAEQPDISWYRKLREAVPSLFSAEQAPVPQGDAERYATVPFWIVLPFLLGLSRIATEQNDQELTVEVLSLIRDVSERSRKLGPASGNYHTWDFFVQMLAALPPDSVDFGALEHVPMWIDTLYGGHFVGVEVITKLIPKFLLEGLPGCPKVERLFAWTTAFKWVDVPGEKRLAYRNRSRVAKTAVEPYFLVDKYIHKRLALEIGKNCGRMPLLLTARRLRAVLADQQQSESRGDDVSLIWLPDIASGPNTGDDDPELIYAYLARELLAGLVEGNPAECSKTVAALLGQSYPYPVFRRLAFHVVDAHWDALKHQFFAVLDREHLREWLEWSSCRVELQRLLSNHIAAFDKDQKQTLGDAIEEGRGPTTAGGPFPEDMVAEWKQEWYSVLTADPFFSPRYSEYRRITGADRTPQPPFRIQFRAGPGPSPRSPAEIQDMDGPTLAGFLDTFVPADPWNGPTLEGLCDSLRKAVSADPAGFVAKLGALSQTKYPFAAHIVWGLMDAWKARTLYDLQPVVAFLKNYTAPDEFWSGKWVFKGEHYGTEPFTVIGMAADLIEDGARQDEHSFDPSLLPDARNLLVAWFGKTRAREQGDLHDPLTSAYNSTRGKLLRAMVIVALRAGRLLRDGLLSDAAKWPIEFQTAFESSFSQNDTDAYVLFGYYLYNFRFLNWEWALGRVNAFKELPNEKPWSSFVYGYLFRGDIEIEVHRAMEPHLRRALTESGLDETSNRRLIELVCVAYLRELDNLGKGGLMDAVLTQWSPDKAQDVIDFFWRGRDSLWGKPERDAAPTADSELEKARKRVLAVWHALCDHVLPLLADQPSDADKAVASAAAKLCIFLPTLDDESAGRLKILARYTRPGADAIDLVEALWLLKDRDRRPEVSERFGGVLEAVVNAAAPAYDLSHIKDMVQYLLDSGDSARPIGKRIRDRYVQMGYHDWANMEPKTARSATD